MLLIISVIALVLIMVVCLIISARSINKLQQEVDSNRDILINTLIQRNDNLQRILSIISKHTDLINQYAETVSTITQDTPWEELGNIAGDQSNLLSRIWRLQDTHLKLSKDNSFLEEMNKMNSVNAVYASVKRKYNVAVTNYNKNLDKNPQAFLAKLSRRTELPLYIEATTTIED